MRVKSRKILFLLGIGEVRDSPSRLSSCHAILLTRGFSCRDSRRALATGLVSASWMVFLLNQRLSHFNADVARVPIVPVAKWLTYNHARKNSQSRQSWKTVSIHFVAFPFLRHIPYRKLKHTTPRFTSANRPEGSRILF